MRHLPLGGLLLIAILTCQPVAHATDPPPGKCVPVLGKRLPGEYHYCVAVNDWLRGDSGSGFCGAK
jgi:hypothetical protein